MKSFLLLAFALALSPIAYAQSLNNVAFAAGTGTLTSLLTQSLSQHGITAASLYGPYHFKMEQRFANHLSVGLSSSIMRNTVYVPMSRNAGSEIAEIGSQVNEEAKRWSYGVAARVNYHIGNSRKFDPYLGAGIGYRSQNWNGSNVDYTGLNYTIGNTSIAYEFGVGARYYFLPGIGVYAELGAGQSPLQAGFIIGLNNNKPTGGGGRNTGNGTPSTQKDKPSAPPASKDKGGKIGLK